MQHRECNIEFINFITTEVCKDHYVLWKHGMLNRVMSVENFANEPEQFKFAYFCGECLPTKFFCQIHDNCYRPILTVDARTCMLLVGDEVAWTEHSKDNKTGTAMGTVCEIHDNEIHVENVIHPSDSEHNYAVKILRKKELRKIISHNVELDALKYTQLHVQTKLKSLVETDENGVPIENFYLTIY